MSEFEERLRQAAARGRSQASQFQSEADRKRMEAEEFKRLHGKYRLILAEHIEHVIKKLIDLFPGFRYQSVFGDAGWGGACVRDDLMLDKGRRCTMYSRFEMSVRPHNEFNVLDLQAKGTIANRELLSRSFYQPIGEADLNRFKELIEQWALAYAELFAANR
jgi:hypothetical protein